MNTIKIERGNTRMIAHRGVSGLETENSIPAFVAAGNRSYYGVETDTHVTDDGRFVVIHDDNTGRVAWEDINVERACYEQIRRVRLKDLYSGEMNGAGGGGERREDLLIPNLEEYVGICRKYEKECILELKNEFSMEHIRRVVEVIRGMKYLEHVTFITFSLNNIRNMRELLPEQSLYYLTCEYNGEILAALKQYRVNLDIYYEALTREIVEELHREGILVNCWTCDNKEEAERLVCWGVDFITTNILE